MVKLREMIKLNKSIRLQRGSLRIKMMMKELSTTKRTIMEGITVIGAIVTSTRENLGSLTTLTIDTVALVNRMRIKRTALAKVT